MMLTLVKEQAPIPPPCYQRAQARLRPALHLDALTLVRTLHLLALCHFAVRVTHRRYIPPLPAGPGGVPRTYSNAFLGVCSSSFVSSALLCLAGLRWPHRSL